MVYSCFNEVIVRSNKTTTPPPSTVSIVRASKFGVSASKSCNWHHHQCVSDQCTYIREHSHLQHTHAVCVSKYLVSLCIVAVAYCGGSYKQLKGVVRVNINATTLQLLLQLTHALLAMTEVRVRERKSHH